MLRSKILFILFLAICQCVLCQHIERLAITDLSSYKMEEAKIHIDALGEENKLKSILKIEYNYLTKGDLQDSLLLNSFSENLSEFQKGVFQMYYADFLNRKTDKFTSNAFNLYLSDLKLFKSKNDTALINENLKRILNHFQKYPKNERQYKFYIEEYKKYKKSRIDDFWIHYYDVSFRMQQNFDNHKKYPITEKSFDSLFQFIPDNAYLKARVFHLKGLFCGNNLKDPGKYELNSKKALEIYKSYPYYFGKRSLANVSLNLGISEFKANDYNGALRIFKNIEKNQYFTKELKLNIFLQDWLFQVYEKLNKKDSSNYYFQKRVTYENQLKEQELAISIHEIDTKYKTQEKDRQISYLKKLALNYQENKIIYFILIGIVFFIAMYSFIRWKRVDYRKQKLTEENESLQIEHSQTIQELEKVKQLVIEDHIVLKNKAKIYLNELLYIKSEDHYLQLFSSKKKEFVRGKISEIIKELPPNFVQTHRSYIVNKNSIISQNGNFVYLEGKIEIPLSRNFKKNI